MTEMQYPIDDMSSTRQDIRKVLDEQWSQHTALFMTNYDSFGALITAIASALPNGAAKVQELEQALSNYHQQYQTAYEKLYELADHIEQAAQAMQQTDQDIKNTFQSHQP